ncbi:MAG: hypothetical protein GTN62_14690 [Gemmatimonadales bacterium]|nr:hypothetical protein [Gemmatimonadales bacterium]NIN13332.1 hypothetical protein [Gemmatimonadales bacterium]NIN51335.1 hypothetical protein [Gemmatimonadales bacterium]NIP08799.1 hypothetical protein [Gemmatimonadales bacterium]NIQ99793.1 hypothetical protein [Gemmatimonadales bacterium]
MKAELRQEIAELRGEMQAGFARLEGKFEQQLGGLRADMVKWMFLFWAGTALTVLGLLRL